MNEQPIDQLNKNPDGKSAVPAAVLDWTKKDRFKLLKWTTIADMQSGDPTEIPTSDLCLAFDGGIAQFQYVPEDEAPVHKISVNPGIYTLVKSIGGLALQPTDLTTGNVLETIDNTSRIKNEINIFFSKLPIYDELNIPKKRSIILFGPPGTGKSLAVNKTIKDLIKEDAGTVALIWPTSEIAPEDISKFLSFAADYAPQTTRVILLMEDIGGGEQEGHGSPRSASAGMLQLLDGVNVSFRLPTFIIATTNHPESLLASLADRPGRFDQMIEIPPPPPAEKIALLEFIAKRPLTSDEKLALESPEAKMLSIAHLKEIVVRSRLHDKTIQVIVKEMFEHTAAFKKGFDKKSKVGIGF
jgi:ATPase family associated with various cellular activities (AAA)